MTTHEERHRIYEEQRQIREKIERMCKTTVTYLRKTQSSLWWHDSKPRLPAYWDVLDAALEAARYIVEELDDGFFEDEGSALGNFFGVDFRKLAPGDAPSQSEIYNSSDHRLEAAEQIVALIQQRRARTVALRKIRALENTTGRTPEEAAAYRAKAAAMRAKL